MTGQTLIRLFSLLVTGFGLVACQMPGPSGAHLYAGNCAQCHGAALAGDGPIADELAVQAPDLTWLARDNGGVFPMLDVIAQIHGYPGRYHRGLMPEFAPELSAQTTFWTAPDGGEHVVPTAILRIARYVESKQR